MSTTWAFGATGQYTATWDGVSQVTVTQTSGGQFIVSFPAQSLTAALASPVYQEILAPTPVTSLGMSLVASTGVAGFALQNGTPSIISWTAPNDGNMHRVMLLGCLRVTSAETGGSTQLAYKAPDGTAAAVTVWGSGFGAGVFQPNLIPLVTVQAGQAVTFQQNAALTAGAAIVWAEIWAS